MLLKTLSIKNYGDIKNILIDFQSPGSNIEAFEYKGEHYHLVQVLTSDFLDAFLDLITSFKLLSNLGKPTVIGMLLKEYFNAKPDVSSFELDFELRNISYRYILQLNAEGVQKEILFENQFLTYNSLNYVRPTPRMPNDINVLFNSINLYNFGSKDQILDLFYEMQRECLTKSFMFDALSKFLLDLEIITKPLILDNRNGNAETIFAFDEATVSYVQLDELNLTTKTAISIFYVLNNILAEEGIYVFLDLGSINLVSRIRILKMMRGMSKLSTKSQVICLDKVYSDQAYDNVSTRIDTAIKVSAIEKDVLTNKFIINTVTD